MHGRDHENAIPAETAREKLCLLDAVDLSASVIRDEIQRVLQTSVPYIYTKDFEEANRDSWHEYDIPFPASRHRVRAGRAPVALTEFIDQVDDIPLYTREEEYHTFRRMHLLSHQASLIQTDLSRKETMKLPDCMKSVYAFDENMHTVRKIRNDIVLHNLRLIVSVAKKFASNQLSLGDLANEGNISLIRVTPRFDYTRGFKFSTFATWVLTNDFLRIVGKAGKYYRKHMHMGEFDNEYAEPPAAEAPPKETVIDCRKQHMHAAILQLLDFLDPREQTIIRYRYGLDGIEAQKQPLTLDQTGDRLGVTRERIRQIQERAEMKMARIAKKLNIDADELLSA